MLNDCYINKLQEINKRCDNLYEEFETENNMSKITELMNNLPSDLAKNSINVYQKMIRGNNWYFPTLKDLSLLDFLTRWYDVHESYFRFATEVYSLLKDSGSIEALVDADLFNRMIISESMRGWVGKRSPAGLDALLNERILKLENMLSHLPESEIDDILYLGGIYLGKSEFITAEKEMISLIIKYNKTKNGSLINFDSDTRTKNMLLRYFCRYTMGELEDKCDALTYNDVNDIRNDSIKELHTFENLMNNLSENIRSEVLHILDEIKALNYLNLNLEVKYSFKGWAGFMHILVFIACSESLNSNDNIYEIYNNLKLRECKL